MTLRNAFAELAVESKQDAAIAAIQALGADLLTDTQLRASPAPVRDDYPAGEILAEQTGNNAVLTFTFAQPVQLVVVESSGDGLVSRADPFGGQPGAGLGWPCRHEVPSYFPVTTSAVQVHAPAGVVVNVLGYRR